jgi:Caspase domain
MTSAGRSSAPVLVVALTWNLLAGGAWAADEVQVEAVVVGVETSALSLPRSVRPSHLDTEAPVALWIPRAEDPYYYHVCFSAGANSPCTYVNYGPSRVRVVQASRGPTAKRINLGLGRPFEENIGEILRGLFPRTRVCREGDAASVGELGVRAELLTEFLEPGNDFYEVKGLKLTVRLTLEGADGGSPDVVEGTGVGLRRKSFWSNQPDWQEIAREALPAALNQLLGAIRSSRLLRARLQELAQVRARPPGLVTTAHLDDSAGLLPNGRLDAGEEARIRTRVTNEGPGPAFNVAVQVRADLPQVTVPREAAIGDLAPGEAREIAFPIAASLDLPSAVARLRIDTTEKRGYGGRPVLLELPTAELLAAKLAIVDVTLNDGTGRAKGDGDGQPANGETIEAIVRVRNDGPGEAARVSVAMAAPLGNVEVLEPQVVVPRIPAGRVEEARLLFRVPLVVEASDLSLAFRAVEARGVRAGSAVTEQRWRLRQKRPAVELAYRLYDGNSAASSGNRDGRINNGERIEVVVTPTNRGELPARGLRIAVASDDPALVPAPAVLEVGDLPPQAEGAAQRFLFDVPRAYGAGRRDGEIHFGLTVAQRDFPPRRELLALSFHALRPDLFLEASSPSDLERGARGEIVLRLRNGGDLRAEDVVVELASETPGVDLLDEQGTPVRSRKVVVGALEPQAVAPEPHIALSVRRSAGLGTAKVHLTVTQRDFRPLARATPLTVTEEAPAVIAAARGEQTSPAKMPSPFASAPAAISFLGNSPGQHLLSEAIVLRFEVQSPGNLAEVRLTQNERQLPLDSARHSAGATGVGQAVQYELPVRLEEGENRFEVVVLTEQGYRSRRSLVLLRDREVGRLWVVAIGIGKYQDPTIPRLSYAEADARAVHEYFRETFGLPEDQVFLRVDEQATLREIKSLLGTQLAARASDPRDTVVLYFAGHGMRERAAGSLDPDGLSKYFLPYDASRNDLYSTALDMDEVANVLRRLVPERVVVLLDSCFSGAVGGRSPFDPRAAEERAVISGGFLERMSRVGKGRVVITASSPEEAAQESSTFGHGVFTFFLLEGLRGAADLDGDGEIDVHEAFAYVSEKVSKATQGRQNPKLKEPDSVGKILLGHGRERVRVKRARPGGVQ